MTIVPEIPAEIAPPHPDQDRTWCDALEDLQTIHGAFAGLDLLVRNQDESFDPYQLATIAMIIEVLTTRFEVLLDTAIGGMLALRVPSAHRPAATPEPEETQP